MFGLARWVIRNKVVAVGALATVAILSSGNKQPVQPANAWAAAPPVTVSYGEPKQQTVSQTAAKALTRVAKTVGVEKLLPSELIDQSKGNLETTDNALKGAVGTN